MLFWHYLDGNQKPNLSKLTSIIRLLFYRGAFFAAIETAGTDNMAQNNHIAQGLRELEQLLIREKESGTDALQFESDVMMSLSKLPMQIQEWASELSKSATPSAPATSVNEETVLAGSNPNADESVSVSVIADMNPFLAANASSQPSGPALVPEGANNREKLIDLFKMAKADEKLKGMDTLFDTLVFATGDPEADVAFVGEAPGAEEEKEKKPFVGPAGQKLNGLIKAMGLTREKVYISNVVKYRPKKDNGRFQGNSNRQPDEVEIAASIKYVKAELQVVQPKVVVAVGKTAAEGLLGLTGALQKIRNQWYDLDGLPVMVTYHPRYLLIQEKNATPDKARIAKRMVWEDMLLVMEKAGLPVSDKQRGYYAG